MATTNQTLQEKEVLLAINIKTMRKDLKQLREADALKEREKIGKIKIPVQAKKAASLQPKITDTLPVLPEEPAAPIPTVKISSSLPKDDELTSETKGEMPKTVDASVQKSVQRTLKKDTAGNIEKILTEHLKQETIANEKIKAYANETERQQIFLWENQKKNLQQQLTAVNQEKDSKLMLQKNDILIQQKNLKKKLQPLIDEEAKNEQKQQELQEQKQASNVPSEQQSLEKERWALEDKKQEIEKNRWATEAELAGLQETIKTLDENYEQFAQKEDALTSQIAAVDASLKDLYAAIVEREKMNIQQSQEIATQDAQLQNEQTKVTERQQRMKQGQDQEKEYLKGVPEAAKEKLATSTKKEEAQRKNFMDEVEKWAASEKEDTNNVTTNE